MALQQSARRLHRTMEPDDLITVATFPDEAQARIAHSDLNAAGIRAHVIGAEVNTALFHVGTALGGVRLQVSVHDAEQAADVLGTATQVDSRPWTCPSCGEDSEAGFNVCWSCGAERLGEGTQPREDSDPQVVEVTGAVRADSGAMADEDDRRPTPEQREQDNAQLALRAFKAAGIGLVFPPMTIYAMFLVYQLFDEPLSDRSRKHFYYSIVLILLALVIFSPLYLELAFGILYD